MAISRPENYPRALELPDILDLICQELVLKGENQTLACLARTSRLFFAVAVPHLWKSCAEFDNILKTIPGAWRDGRAPHIVNSDAKRVPYEKMFERVALYAPWVVSIKVQNRAQWQDALHPDDIVGIQALAHYVANHGMFTRLKTLDLYFDPLRSDDLPGVAWIFLLLSPSIVNLAVNVYPPGLTSCNPAYLSVLQVFLGAALNTCTNLGSLTMNVLPRTIKNIPSLSYSVPTVANIAALPKLEALITPMDISNPELFGWISRMPQLKTLNAFGEPFNTIPRSFQPWPTDAFPSLSCLGCSLGTLAAFNQLWRSPIVQHLNDANIGFPFSCGHEDIRTIFNLIISRSPRLSKLHLRVSSTSNRQLPLEIIQALPLSSLHISGFHGDNTGSLSLLARVGAYWPALSVLALPDHKIAYQDLLTVSACLPRLKHLQVTLPTAQAPLRGVDIPERPPVSRWPDHRLELRARQSQGRCIEYYSKAELDTLALFLAMVWPGMMFSFESRSTALGFLVQKGLSELIKRHSAKVLAEFIAAS